MNLLSPNLLPLRAVRVLYPLDRNHSPSANWFLVPQWVSLDAPLVAIAWQLLFALSLQIGIHPLVLLLTSVSVWIIYVSDHLLDARRGRMYSSRHRFAAQHAKIFLPLLAIACAIGCWLCHFLPRSISLCGVFLSAAVAVYLVTIHRGKIFNRSLPKELLVALLFAAGSTIQVWSDPQVLQSNWLALMGFAGVCLANCVAVDCWEWQSVEERHQPPHPLVRWLGRHLKGLCLILLLLGPLVSRNYGSLAIATAGSAALLLLLSRLRQRYTADVVRLLADLCLLIPPIALLVIRL